MTVNTQILLDTTVYGEASGNYDGSSTDWFSDPVTAANYYRGRGGIQTVLIRVTDFVGLIRIQATLDTLPDTATWFDTYEYGDPSSGVPITDYHPATITGNFVWLRARIENFEQGTINAITVSY
jgi:hypothetical protein